MNIEIQEFYPLKKKHCELEGSLTVYLIDHDLDIRGIAVQRRKGRYFFRLPCRTALDENGQRIIEDGRRISYPIVTFASKNNQDALMKAIYDNAPAFIESWLKEVSHGKK